MSTVRNPEYPIDPIFINRWSPRAFSGEELPEATLFSFFEAARWSPSAYNSQPWRFLYARRNTPQWPVFLDLLAEFNRSWAQNASALVFALSKKSFTPPGKTESIQMVSHSFDAGSAWTGLALQASLSGWHTHGIGGFDRAKTRETLGIPEDYALEAAIAIGKQADKSILPVGLQEREQPSLRRPVAEWVAEGLFAFE